MAFSRIALIYNPVSGRPRERTVTVDRFIARMRDAGRSVVAYRTQGPGEATAFARQAVAEGCDLILAHGGDGTMNEVLQAVVGTEATLGFWPGGTANVLAAEIGFPSRVDRVVARIEAGKVRRVTVGKANDRYFLLMAGVGFDAAVAAGVDPALKRRLGKGAFAVSAFRYMFRDWNPSPVRVQVDGEVLEARFVIAGNAKSYGGGFKLTPQAELTDPHLDLCLYDADRVIDYVKLAAAAVTGRHLKLRGVTYRKVRRAQITTVPGEDVLVQLDGEVVDHVPLTLEAVPEGVKLLI